jgi:hypothetical protein
MSDERPDPEDERPAVAGAAHALPDHLDAPLEADEADVVEQSIEEPLRDEGI